MRQAEEIATMGNFRIPVRRDRYAGSRTTVPQMLDLFRKEHKAIRSFRQLCTLIRREGGRDKMGECWRRAKRHLDGRARAAGELSRTLDFPADDADRDLSFVWIRIWQQQSRRHWSELCDFAHVLLRDVTQKKRL